MSDLRGKLARLLHDLWSDEIQFILKKYLSKIDIATLGIQNSSYDDLSENDKKHYEDQARQIIKIFEDYIQSKEWLDMEDLKRRIK